LKTSFSKFAFNAVKWSGFSQFGRHFFQIVTSIVLARLLLPEDFGLIGMAFIVIGFLNIFKDLGTSAAIIQKLDISERLLSSVFWLNLLVGLFISLTVFAFSNLICKLFNDIRVGPVLSVLSISFFITGLGNVHQALMEKKLLFKKLAKIEIVAIFISSFLGIFFAIEGFKVWSLVIQNLSALLLTSVLLWFNEKWHPSYFIKINELKGLSRFSSFLTGFNFFNYFCRNADNFLIGKYLGAANLGYYNLAYRIMLYPMQSITVVISRVMFPLYSRINEDHERFRVIYIKVSQAIALITFPLMILLMVVRKEFVLNVFGKNWQSAEILILILAPVGMIQSIDATVGSIYQATGRTDIMFKWGIYSGIFSIIVFVIGLQWGVVGVALGYLIFTVLLLLPGLYIPFKLIDLKVILFLKNLFRIFLISLSMGVIIYLMGIILTSHGLFDLILKSIVSVFIYVSFNLIFNKKIINEILKIIQKPSGES
jgi:O-antigen/teichoic acid export membrane protein